MRIMRRMGFSITGLIVAALLSGCGTRARKMQEATDAGYKLGTSDSIKRQYWLKQAMEKRTQVDDDGRRVYYTFEDQEITPDGRKTVPRKKTVSVIE